jgi:hypothetical protein
MADLQFSRNTKVFLKQGSNVWEIPVLDGYSFSQATNASEITLNEMADASGNSRRSRQMFNDSFAPAEWSFSSYARPNAGTVVEEALWANFVANNTYVAMPVAPADHWLGCTTSGNQVTFNFSESNKTVLGTYDLYFVMGACGHETNNFNTEERIVDDVTIPGDNVTIYKIADCVGNEASIDFDIDGIATINWSGFGKVITEEATFDASGALNRSTASTSNFIRNRLTSLALQESEGTTYNLVLTGGNITFSNNITFLTPETLCTINQPLGHVTGTRSISGNFTCYLNSAADSSADLFENLMEDKTTVTNKHALTFSIGGNSAPKMVVSMPTAHLEVPTHSIEDVISLEANFHALPSTIGGTDEATIAYTGS